MTVTSSRGRYLLKHVFGHGRIYRPNKRNELAECWGLCQEVYSKG